MTLVKLLLTQREILFTSLLALVPLLAAVLVLLLPRLRRWVKASARRRRARQAERMALAASLSDVAAEPPLPEEVPEEGAPTPDAPDEASQKPVPTPTTAEAGVASSTEEAEIADTEETSSAIQEILDSVFEDEEANARYETLLKGTIPVMAVELILLCDAIAGQLRQRKSESSGR